MALQDKYINPFTDFGFKKLFGSELNKDLLIDFLNQVLPGKHKIKDLTYARTEQLGNTETDRKAIFDLYCIGENGERFIVAAEESGQRLLGLGIVCPIIGFRPRHGRSGRRIEGEDRV